MRFRKPVEDKHDLRRPPRDIICRSIWIHDSQAVNFVGIVDLSLCIRVCKGALYI